MSRQDRDRDRQMRMMADTERHRATTTGNLLALQEHEEREMRVQRLTAAGAAREMTHLLRAEQLASAYRRPLHQED